MVRETGNDMALERVFGILCNHIGTDAHGLMYGFDEASRAVLADLGCGGWQPIETAPKHAEFQGVLVYHLIRGEGLVDRARLYGDVWRVADWSEDQIFPTHWMPLPPPPETAK
jgi:hypothetical protein